MAKVSVIMGVYNCANTVSAAIASIKAQSYNDWEFVICDDASTDNTFELVQEEVRGDPRFILLRNKRNLALAATLNKCIQVSTGEYLARQDADDCSLPERFTEQVKFLDQFQDVAAVGTYAELFDDKGNVWGIMKHPFNASIVDWLRDSCLIHPSVMMRRQPLLKVGLYRPNAVRVEDYDLWLKMIVAGYKLVTIPMVLYKYHLDFSDYRRRRFKYRLNEVQVKWRAIKQMSIPFHYYFFLLKPLLVGLLPKRLLYAYHYRKYANNKLR